MVIHRHLDILYIEHTIYKLYIEHIYTNQESCTENMESHYTYSQNKYKVNKAN